MPRVKIDYVVSFSSEDPEHPASNLLAWEVSKKKWLCKKGEPSCSVVLQLSKAVKISAVHVGAYHSALVEVLVARSELPSDQFQVLVPSCVLLPAAEARRDAPVARVRSFAGDQLTAARAQRWDRVRVVCSQPYNKHCKYGLSFVHIDESSDAPPAVVPQRLLAMDTFSSDEEEFRPGELFAKHLQKNSDSQGSSSDTGAQIRQATSQALKNISDSSTKLMKAPIAKPSGRGAAAPSAAGRADRSRDTLLYTDEDERPHARIDQLVQLHKDQKEKDDKERTNEKAKEEKRTPKRRKSSSPPSREAPPTKRPHKNSRDGSSDRASRRDDKRNRQQASSEDPGQESGAPHELLRDVVLVLSGYEHPLRARIRNAALALGAQVQRDWGPACTHLICAFPNTPKLRAVRASGGHDVPVAQGEWVLQCAARRRRLPWRWFATEPRERRTPPPETAPSSPSPPPAAQQRSDTDCDTDEEIEKVLKKQKAKRAGAGGGPPSPDGGDVGGPTDDEGGPTDDEGGETPAVPRLGGALPSFFEGLTFAVDETHADAAQLARYIRAYGGLALQLSELEEDSEVDYVVTSGSSPGTGDTSGSRAAPRVSPGWVARCHRAGALLPPD